MKMKRVLATILTTVLMTASLAGCGNSATQNVSDIDVEKYVTSLGEYKGMELAASKLEVTEDYIDSYIEYMLLNNQTEQEVTGRAVQTGDVVNIDYVGTKDGVAFEGGTAEGYDLTIGSGQFIDGFEDGLIGTNIGDTVDLNLTFPEDYHSTDLAGAAVVFTVTVNSISEMVTPELNDEYVKGLGMEDCETVEQYREVVRINLEQAEESNFQNELQTQVAEKLFEIAEFSEDVPEDIYNQYIAQIDTNVENYAAQFGVGVTEFITQFYGMTEEDFIAEKESSALNTTRQALVCAMIAEKEGIEVTDEELQQKVEENYASFGFESAEAYMENGDAETYRDSLLAAEVLQFLIDNAVITEPTDETNETEATEAE